jgi:hypothetical protein
MKHGEGNQFSPQGFFKRRIAPAPQRIKITIRITPAIIKFSFNTAPNALPANSTIQMGKWQGQVRKASNANR